MGSQSFTREQTGASEVVGVVLLFGLVLAAATFVLVAGSSTLNSAQNQAQLDSAEQSVETLNTELKSVSAKQSDATTDLQLRSTEINDVSMRHETTISMEATYDSGATRPAGGPHEVEVGSVVYTHGDGTRVVSQAGAVWRVSDTGTTTLTEPPFEYRDGALVFKIVNTTGRFDPVDGTVRARRDPEASTAQTEAVYDAIIDDVDGDGSRDLPDTITFDIDGPNEDAWLQYFQSEFGDDSRVTIDSGTATFELISSVEAGTPTNDNAHSITEFADRKSKHVFQYTVQGDLEGNLEAIEVAYDGDPDLSTFETQGTDGIQSLGVDTNNDGFLDTTVDPDEVVTDLDITDDSVSIELDTSASAPASEKLSVSDGDTIMLRYGTLEEGSVTNPADPTDDGVSLTFEDDQGNTASVSDASLDLRPDITPITFDNEELQLKALDIQLEHLNTAFETNASNEESIEVPNDIVIVSDESGSMSGEADTRVDATQEFVDAVDDEDQVATVHFSETAQEVQGLSDPEDIEPETNTGGGTNYFAGLQTALDILDGREPEEKENRNAAIIFLGDGAHNSGPSDDEVRALAEQAGEDGVTINTIGLGLGGNNGNAQDARDLLQDMANNAGGSFANVNEANLVETYEQLAENINRENFEIAEEPVSVTTSINDEAYTFDDDGGDVLTPGSGTASNNLPLTDPSEDFAEPSQSVPDAEIPSTQEFLNGETVRVALQFNEHGCDLENGEFENTNDPVSADAPGNPTDKKYKRLICPARESDFPVRATGPGSDRYHVLTDENSFSDLPTPETEFWQTPLEEALEDEGVLDGGTLDLADNEALIIVEAPNTNTDNENVGINPTGYAAFKVTADGAVEPRFNNQVLEPGEDRLFGIAVQEVELDE